MQVQQPMSRKAPRGSEEQLRYCSRHRQCVSRILGSALHDAAQVQLQMSQEALRKSEERLRTAVCERQDSAEGHSRR